MKLATFFKQGQTRLGVVDGSQLIDLNLAQPQVPADLRTALTAGVDLTAAAEKALASNAPRILLEELTLAPLVPEPGKTICLGLNYVDHAKESGRDKPEYPWFFLRAKSSLMGHGADARVPRISAKLDYEAELALVIGSRVPRHVTQAQALDYVLGYSCFNDMSVRDYQKRTPQWTIGKNFDSTGAFGPILVSADELPPGARSLRIQGRLNGKLMQEANTSDMLFGVAETVALLSECLTLEAGDVIVMGTPAGVGQSRTPPVWLKDGDTFSVEIDGIGELVNPIRDEAP